MSKNVTPVGPFDIDQEADEIAEDVVTDREALLFLGAVAVQVSMIAFIFGDKDYDASMRATEHGETADAVFRWEWPSMAIVGFVMFGMLFAFALRSPWYERNAPRLVWMGPALWFLLWLTVFRPHS